MTDKIFTRQYRCYVKGRRLETQVIVTGVAGRWAALMQYANSMGLKTIECDAVWVKD